MLRKLVRLKLPRTALSSSTFFNPYNQRQQGVKLTVTVMARRIIRLKVPSAKLASGTTFHPHQGHQ